MKGGGPAGKMCGMARHALSFVPHGQADIQTQPYTLKHTNQHVRYSPQPQHKRMHAHTHMATVPAPTPPNPRAPHRTVSTPQLCCVQDSAVGVPACSQQLHLIRVHAVTGATWWNKALHQHTGLNQRRRTGSAKGVLGSIPLQQKQQQQQSCQAAQAAAAAPNHQSHRKRHAAALHTLLQHMQRVDTTVSN